MLITRTTVQNRAVFDNRRRRLEVMVLAGKRDSLQSEFDHMFETDVEMLTEESVQRANDLMGQIAKLNKLIGIKGSTRIKQIG
jgi:hypothetical protein